MALALELAVPTPILVERDPSHSPRSVLQVDHHSLAASEASTETDDSLETPQHNSLVTPKRRILDRPTSPYYLKRNNYYSKLRERAGRVLETTMADLMWDELKP